MIDAILHVLHEIGPAKLTLWTWTAADYEITHLIRNADITSALLILDRGLPNKNHELIRDWRLRFGEGSVWYVLNHAKIATIENERYRWLLRGSLNLNCNPRFEQFDLTEGGTDFDLMKQVEAELPNLPDQSDIHTVREASRVGDAFGVGALKMFGEVRPWKK